MPEYTADVVALGTLRLLEALRDYVANGGSAVRFYQAGSSEMFGAAPPPQSETTPFHPRSPYAVSKVAAHWYAVNYREAYGLFVCNGILFNHESPRRGETFVTRKITRAVGAHQGRAAGQALSSAISTRKRDWGFAGDYVEAMWLMLQQPEPDDYVVATGEAHSVRRARRAGLRRVGLDWQRACRDRPALPPPDRGRFPAGRRRQGARDARLAAAGQLPRAGRDDGRARPRPRAPGARAQGGRLDRAGPRRGAGRPELGDGRSRADLFPLAGRRVFVAGHRGMVGARAGAAAARGTDCEILTAGAQRARSAPPGARPKPGFAERGPDAVFVAAATVGGILANDTRPAEFLYDNLVIATNVIEAARRTGVEKLLFLGSSCIYPRLAPQPMAEEALLTGPLEPTNQWYAIAKIAGLKLCAGLSPAIWLRLHLGAADQPLRPRRHLRSAGEPRPPGAPGQDAPCAKLTGAAEVEIWGTGRPRREFLHVDDLADALVFLMERYSGEAHVNVGWGEDVSIAELAAPGRAKSSASRAASVMRPTSRTARRASCSTSAGCPGSAGGRGSGCARGSPTPIAGSSRPPPESVGASFDARPAQRCASKELAPSGRDEDRSWFRVAVLQHHRREILGIDEDVCFHRPVGIVAVAVDPDLRIGIDEFRHEELHRGLREDAFLRAMALRRRLWRVDVEKPDFCRSTA